MDPRPHRTPRLPRRRLLAAGLGALWLPSGCGGGTPRPGTAGGTAPPGGTLTAATADDVRTVDPALAFDTWSTAVVHACTRRLTDWDGTGKLVNDLAAGWEASGDGRSYTFRLREGLVFADGAPLEAAHFVAALERVRRPETASPGAGFYARLAALEARDARTLVVVLQEPDPTLPSLMGMTFAAPVREGEPARPGEAAPSSGPYRVETFEPGVRVVLARNPRDAANPSRLERLVLQLGVDQSLQLTRMAAGEVDLLPSVPPARLAQILADPAEQDNLARGVVNQTWYFGMHTRRPPWHDPRVRRAALLALDRARHVQLAGSGKEANGILPPFVPGYNPQRTLPAPDPAAARDLLAAAGISPTRPPRSTPTLWLAGNEQNLRHAEAIQQDLRAAGLPVELRPLTLSQFLTGYRKEADCWYNGWYPDFPDAGNFMEPVFHGRNIGEGKSNASRYHNPRFDSLLDRARLTPLGPDREALYRQAEDLLLTDLPWIPLFFEEEVRYFRDGVTGVTVHPVWRQMLTGIDRR